MIHIVRKSIPRFTRFLSLVLIRLVFTEIQPFENVKRRIREGNFFAWEGGHACGFLFNFSKVTENAIITIKLLIFFHIFSDVAIGSENSP